MASTENQKAARGKRLRRTREALGYKTAREFAAVTGEAEKTLSAWERGQNDIPLRYVERIKRRFSITSDWIYFGDAAGLPHALARELMREVA
jgi:transcriptional regulator with XRE-family HTH domain